MKPKLLIHCILLVGRFCCAPISHASEVCADGVEFDCPETTVAMGSLVGWVDLDDRIVLRPIGDESLKLVALSIESEAGLLQPIPGGPSASPTPFELFLANDNERITYANFGRFTEIVPEGVEFAGYDVQRAVSRGLDPCNEIVDLASLFETAQENSFCTLPGDLDFDGQVSFSDVITLTNNFGMLDAVWPDGDFDWDRQVGFSDLLLMSQNFGDSVFRRPRIMTIPEPETATNMLCLYAVALHALITNCRWSLD